MLELRNISKSFGTRVVWQGVNLTVERGEIVAITGESGCGKTTLLHSIAGFHHLDSGGIWLNNHPVDTLPIHQRNVGLVVQDYCLFPHLNVLDNITFGLRERGVPKKERHRRGSKLMDECGIRHTLTTSIRNLSGGEQQRVALARALIVEPEVLLLDEPFAALDQQRTAALRALVCAMVRQYGIPTIIVTHNQHEAATMAHRIATMRDVGLHE